MLKEVGQFCSNIFPTFYSNLERLYFEVGEEKTCGPHHFSLPLPLSTKQWKLPFFTLFSILPVFTPTKHTLKHFCCCSLFWVYSIKFYTLSLSLSIYIYIYFLISIYIYHSDLSSLIFCSVQPFPHYLNSHFLLSSSFLRNAF